MSNDIKLPTKYKHLSHFNDYIDCIISFKPHYTEKFEELEFKKYFNKWIKETKIIENDKDRKIYCSIHTKPSKK